MSAVLPDLVGRTVSSMASRRAQCGECGWESDPVPNGHLADQLQAAHVCAPDSRMRYWVARSACNEGDTDLFFSDKAQDVDLAKSICQACPVRARCLRRALESGDNDYGTLGGMTAAERRALQQPMRRRTAA